MTLSKIVGEVKVPTSRGIWCKEKGTPLKFIHKTQIKALERKDVSSTDATKSGPVLLSGGGEGEQSCRRCGRRSSCFLSCWSSALLSACLSTERARPPPSLPLSPSCLTWLLFRVLEMALPRRCKCFDGIISLISLSALGGQAGWWGCQEG